MIDNFLIFQDNFKWEKIEKLTSMSWFRFLLKTQKIINFKKLIRNFHTLHSSYITRKVFILQIKLCKKMLLQIVT